MFNIVVGSDLYFGSIQPAFTCTFFCQTECGAFPDSEWTDFAETVLSWWSDAVSGAVHPAEMKCKLLFEDGPFWIDVTKQNGNALLHFNTDRRNTQTIPDAQMPFRELASEVEKALRKLSSSLYLAQQFEASKAIAIKAAQLRAQLSSSRTMP